MLLDYLFNLLLEKRLNKRKDIMNKIKTLFAAGALMAGLAFVNPSTVMADSQWQWQESTNTTTKGRRHLNK